MMGPEAAMLQARMRSTDRVRAYAALEQLGDFDLYVAPIPSEKGAHGSLARRLVRALRGDRARSDLPAGAVSALAIARAQRSGPSEREDGRSLAMLPAKGLPSQR
ncbi:MAG TPA: hypothetical protein VEL82_04620 [Thermoplasmata archaeon]|nr:hypothetical protein [Thermoplasmata archaeon]